MEGLGRCGSDCELASAGGTGQGFSSGGWPGGAGAEQLSPYPEAVCWLALRGTRVRGLGRKGGQSTVWLTSILFRWISGVITAEAQREFEDLCPTWSPESVLWSSGKGVPGGELFPEHEGRGLVSPGCPPGWETALRFSSLQRRTGLSWSAPGHIAPTPATCRLCHWAPLPAPFMGPHTC